MPRRKSATPPNVVASRAIIRLELDRAAKTALDELCERRGATQISVLSRMTKWFGGQDEVIQASVLGLLSDDALSAAAAALLKRAAPRGR